MIKIVIIMILKLDLGQLWQSLDYKLEGLLQVGILSSLKLTYGYKWLLL